MARLTSIGFELNSLTNGMEWTATTGAGATIQTGTVRSGTYAGRINGLTSGVVHRYRYTFFSGTGSGPFYFRQYLRIATLPSAANRIVAITNSATDGASVIAYLTLDNTGALTLFDEDGQIGSASSALSTGVWYRVEMLLDQSAAAGSHVVRARIDGTEFAGAANRSLSGGVSQYYVGGNLAAEAQTVGDWFYDDIAINDAVGSFQTSYPGNESLAYLRPDAIGDNAQWTPTAGDNYTNVDETPPNDVTDTVSSTTLNQIDDYNLSATPAGMGINDVINFAAVGVRFNTPVAALVASYVLRIKASAGGTVEESAAQTPDNVAYRTNTVSAPRNYFLTTYDMPGASTTAWTKADLDTAQIGYRISTGGTNVVAVSATWLVVGYSPPLDLTVSVSDSVTVTESIGRMLQSYVSSSDSVTVTESVNQLPTSNVSTSDTITITENVARLETNFVNVLDNIAITESSAVSIESIGDLTLSVSDSITISESLQRMLQSFVSVSDSITITESVNRLLVSFVTVSDSVTITESSLVLLTARVSVSDAITITESVSLLIPVLFITASDSITLSESVSLFRTPLFVSVSDSLTITENVSVSIPATGGNVSTSDTITVSEEMSRYTDLIAVREEVTVQIVAGIPERNINVSDTITITESIGKLITELFIRILDTRLQDEAGNFLLDEAGNYLYDEGPIDLITVSESVGRTQIHNITKSDTITITESIGRLQTSFISKSDTITVSENVSLFSATLGPKVSDTITVSESVVISQPENPTYTITVNLSNNVVTINDLANTITVTVPENIIRADLSPGTTTVRIL